MVVADAFNPSTQEAEARQISELKPKSDLQSKSRTSKVIQGNPSENKYDFVNISLGLESSEHRTTWKQKVRASYGWFTHI